MSKELRCDSKKHAVLIEKGVFEIKCDSRFCGAGPGKIVLHQFDTETGDLIRTLRYRDTRRRHNATDDNPAAVRPAGHQADGVHRR